jgi:hypothetical protein
MYSRKAFFTSEGMIPPYFTTPSGAQFLVWGGKFDLPPQFTSPGGYALSK